jgi:HEPN domain-containing protein
VKRVYYRRVKMQRTHDWLRQARKDLEHAKKSVSVGDYEWSCFSAQQAAEKGVKALFQALRAEVVGHSVSMLLKKVPKKYAPSLELINQAKILDRHYIPSRYPNFHPEGAPLDYYTREDAEEAVKIAEKIIKFCEDKICAIEGEG